MASAPRRTLSRPVSAAASLACVAIALSQGVVSSQSPSVPPGSPPAASAGTGALSSAAPVDVGAIAWRPSKQVKSFVGTGDKNPMAFDLAVGPDGRFLLVGVVNDMSSQPTKAIVWGSDDGVRWTALKGSVPKSSQAAAVLATDDGFLIAGDAQGGPLLRSSDGTTLSKLEAPAEGLPTGGLFALDRSPVGLVAAGRDAQGPAMWTSADGITWTGTPIPEAFYIIHVATTDSGTMVALGTQQDANGNRTPVTWSSTDGVTWTAAPLPVAAGDWSVPDLERTPLGLIATVVGLIDGERTGAAWLSTDGLTWTQALEVPSRLTVGTAGTEAILFGADTWWHSADGVTWTEAAAPRFNGFQVETSAVRPDGAVIAAGYLYSTSGGSEVRTWVGAPRAQE